MGLGLGLPLGAVASLSTSSHLSMLKPVNLSRFDQIRSLNAVDLLSFGQSNMSNCISNHHLLEEVRKLSNLELNYVVPNDQVDALHDLYTSTNGLEWNWQQPEEKIWFDMEL
jgi:hypothetical protein